MSDTRTVTIPNVGDIDFPSSMSDEQITSAIQKNYPNLAPKPQAPALPTEHIDMAHTLPATQQVSGGPRPLAAGYKPITAQVPEELPFMKQYVDPILNKPLARNLVDLNPIANWESQKLYGKKPSEAIDSALAPQVAQPGEILVPESKLTKVGKGVGRAVWRTEQGLITPANLGLGAGMAVAPEVGLTKVAEALFSGQQLKEGAKELGQAYNANDIGEKAEQGVSGGLNLALGGLLGLHLGHDAIAGTQAKVIADTAERHAADQVKNTPPVETPKPPTSEPAIPKPEPPVSAKVYHGTPTKFEGMPSTEGLGAHYTPAKDVATAIAGDQGRVLEGDISLKKPLRVDDLSGSHSNAEGVVRGFVKQGVLPKSFLKSVDEGALYSRSEQIVGDIGDLQGPELAQKRMDAFQQANQEVLSKVKDYLKSKGYDGLVYKNQVEGGGDSYVAFDPGQVHQAQTPSPETPVMPTAEASMEPKLRKAIGSLIRIKQLQTAAKDRLNVQLALKDAQADLPIGAQYVESVGKALGMDPATTPLYHLAPDQIDRLQQMLKEGKQSTALDSEHPEYKFAPNGIAKLSEINESSLRAAGVPSPKDRFAMLTPEQKAAMQRFKGQSINKETSVEERADLSGGAGLVSRGRDADTLQLEHDMAQASLGKRYAQTLKYLKDTLPEWQKERAGQTEPSQLSLDLSSLQGRVRQSVPKEYYAVQHLTPKTSEGPFVKEPSKATNTPKAAKLASAAQAPDYSVRDHVKEIMGRISENHGTDAAQASRVIFDAVGDKFKDPKAFNEAVLKVMSRYETNLDMKVSGPIKDALENVLSKMPGEGTTLHANPVGPVVSKAFGGGKAVAVTHPLPTIKFPESPIGKFTEKLEQRQMPTLDESAQAFFHNQTEAIKDTIASTPQWTKSAFDRLSEMTKSAWDAYKTRPGLNPLEWALGGRRLALTRDALLMHHFVERINKLHPDVKSREAMVNYLQAGGGVRPDLDVGAELKLKENSFANTSRENTKLKEGYARAQNLTDREKQTVQEYREYLKHMEAQEAASGVELHQRENYIRQIWSDNSIASLSANGVFHAGSFSTKAQWMKMRKYEDYFEGEQAGLVPHHKDFSYLVAARARSSAQVLANRAMIEQLYDSTMDDGSKLAQVAGVGVPQGMQVNPDKGDVEGAILVKSSIPKEAITADGRPYVAINHPAFANWKWVNTTEGVTTLYRGNMLVHPDVAKQLSRVLQPSALRGNVVGRTLLKTSSIGKQTLLVGLFHPVQLATHFLEHAAEGSTTARAMKTLNPMSKPIIDMSERDQQMLVVHGLKVADFNAEGLWDEGVMSRGMANGFPIIGKFLYGLHEAMFTRYIPNIKMGMALDSLQRNTRRYYNAYEAEALKKGMNSKAASFDAQSRIYRMTAEQMNAAFGGINWDHLPVNKTWQDVARLTVLAPDFLLARAQFVGDAFRPGGRESFRALATGAFIQYTAARAFNAAMNDGDAKWNIHDWNKFIVGHHEYSLRTVQGDLLDSILDTRRFLRHRENPLTIRPIAEAWSGKDVFGHPASAGQQMFDFAKNIVPMPLQGIADAFGSKINPNLRQGKSDETIADSILQSFGLQRRQYRTPAERFVYEKFDNIQGDPTDDTLALEQKNTFRQLRQDWIDGTLKPDKIKQAMMNGSLKPSQFKYLFRTAKNSRLVNQASHLEPNQVLDAWKLATPMERLELAPILFSKAKKLPPQERPDVYKKVGGFVSSLPAGQRAKLMGKITDQVNYDYPMPAAIQQAREEAAEEQKQQDDESQQTEQQ